MCAIIYLIVRMAVRLSQLGKKLVFKIAFKNALRIKLGVDGLLNHKEKSRLMPAEKIGKI